MAVPCAVRDRYLIESCDPGRPSFERCRSWCLAGLISCWEGLRRDGPLMAGWMLNYICFIHTRALFAHFQCKYCHPRLAGAFSRGWQAMYRIHPSAWFEIGEPHRSVCPWLPMGRVLASVINHQTGKPSSRVAECTFVDVLPGAATVKNVVARF